MFIRNCWYVAAWSHEVDLEGWFARKVLGEPLLLMRRRGDGRVVSLEDRCAHRQAPLSLGCREGDTVRCMYHGLAYDSGGRCIQIPGQDHVPTVARVRSYPVEERNSWIWVWMGDPARADATTIPESIGLDHPEWRLKGGHLHYQANQQLILDNLLDFSHLTYVHRNTFGGNPKWGELRPEVMALDNGVRVGWTIPDIPPAPFARDFGSGDGNVDLVNAYDFVLPGVLLLASEVRALDPKAARPVLSQRSSQAVTPETATTSHYFFGYGPHASYAEPALVEGMFVGAMAAFEEDRRMIEAQQRNLAPDQPFVPITADGALVRFRRLVAQRLRDEQPA